MVDEVHWLSVPYPKIPSISSVTYYSILESDKQVQIQVSVAVYTLTYPGNSFASVGI